MYRNKKSKKKILNDVDVENCGASRGFGFIYIYIYIDNNNNNNNNNNNKQKNKGTYSNVWQIVTTVLYKI